MSTLRGICRALAVSTLRRQEAFGRFPGGALARHAGLGQNSPDDSLLLDGAMSAEYIYSALPFSGLRVNAFRDTAAHVLMNLPRPGQFGDPAQACVKVDLHPRMEVDVKSDPVPGNLCHCSR